MTTLTKIIVTTLLALMAFSCNFDFNSGIEGNGNVTTETRTLNSDFDEIDTARGLEIILTNGNSEKVIVEADENLQDIITVEVVNNVLKISTDKNIASSATKKVHVTYDNLDGIESSSGSSVYSNETISAANFDIDTSSGSSINITLNADTVSCDSSSGSIVSLAGKADNLHASSSSGSVIKATNLKTQNATVKASSGGNINVNTSNILTAKASSGGNVSYSGNPGKINKSDNVSGSITEM